MMFVKAIRRRFRTEPALHQALANDVPHAS
jgi:hypothetical protein